MTKEENADITFLFFSLNPLPEDKILDLSKLKQISDDILNCI